MKEKCCGCIIIENNKVLLIKQVDGHISFPKGHVENNETEEETAIRETLEETGLNVEIIDGYRYTQNYVVKENIPKEVVFFLAKIKDGELIKQESEISEIGFYNIDDALNIITYDDTKKVLKDLINDLDKTKKTY